MQYPGCLKMGVSEQFGKGIEADAFFAQVGSGDFGSRSLGTPSSGFFSRYPHSIAFLEAARSLTV